MTTDGSRTTVSDIQTALQLPQAALVNQRVPKKLLAERGAPTAADRKLIQEHVESLQWIAALRPANVGIASFVDASREYLETSVLGLQLRGIDCLSIKSRRLAELTHRAVPYPVLLAMDDGTNLGISLWHIRRAQDGTASTVLDGEQAWAIFPPVTTSTTPGEVTARQRVLEALRVGREAWPTIWHLYEAWIEVLVAWEAVPLTGAFALPTSADQAVAIRQAVHHIIGMGQQIESLRRSATKEKQLSKLADINQTITRLRRQVDLERERLSSLSG